MNENWKDDLFDEMYKEYPSMDVVEEETYATKEKEVALIHPTLGTGMILRSNGVIEGFADYNLGFRFHPADSSLSIYASKIKVHGEVEKVEYTGEINFFVDEALEVQDYLGYKEEENG